jgi:hypothetical protein
MKLDINDLGEHDLDALRRALAWGRAFQKREPQLKLFPETMPTEGTQAWLELARYFVSKAQSHTLGLKPWQTPPIDADAAICKPEEIALRRTLHDLNISLYEPDAPTAIANATHQHVQTRSTPHRRDGRHAAQAKGK